MTHDPVNEVTTITLQTFQIIYFFTFNFVFENNRVQVASSSIGFIVMNWNKSGNIYSKLRKADSLFVAYS